MGYFWIIFFFFVVLGVHGDPTPPSWGGNSPYFEVRVNLTNPSPVAYWKFDYFYDSRLNASRYQHYPPQFDEMCANLPFGNDSQCNVIFATDGWSYLEFPDEGWCCKCESKFGSVRKGWLAEDSVYDGTSVISGLETYHWEKQGQYLNHYYCTADDKELPVRFNEIWQGSLKQWDFDLTTYEIAPERKEVFDPPKDCTDYCQSPACVYYR